MCRVIALVLIMSAYLLYAMAEPAPKYIVNLDMPAIERWTPLVKTYKKDVVGALTFLTDIFPKKLVPIAVKIGNDIDLYFSQPYADEIRGIATAVGLPLGDAVLLNIIYELSAYCTSIVAQDVSGHIFHGRNLDFDHADVLRHLTVSLVFQKGNVTQYRGVTYVGYVGLITGQRDNAFTLSFNQRDKGSILYNLVEALLGGKMVSHAARDLLATEGSSFSSALNTVKSERYIAPSYIIIGGIHPGEGAVVTRDRARTLEVWLLSEGVDDWYILETNYDRWLPPPVDDNRRDPAKRAMNDTTSRRLDAHTLYGVLSSPKVLNNGTSYTTVMSAADPTLFYTNIRHPDTS